MLIRELMEDLSQLDPDLRVVVAGYEGGFNDIQQIKTCTLRLNVHSDWYYGSHADVADQHISDRLPDSVIADAVALLGENKNSEGLGGYDLIRNR